ncbi:hypothetical protein FACS1894166_05010 [Bacilli bacterium]|nr:hypothetical protein FACS1894166_05010 [Bacilli bacterium]
MNYLANLSTNKAIFQTKPTKSTNNLQPNSMTKLNANLLSLIWMKFCIFEIIAISQSMYKKNKIMDRPIIMNQKPLAPNPLAKPVDDVAEIIIMARKLTSIITIKPIDIYNTHLPKAMVAFKDIRLPINAQIKKANPPAAKTNIK